MSRKILIWAILLSFAITNNVWCAVIDGAGDHLKVEKVTARYIKIKWDDIPKEELNKFSSYKIYRSTQRIYDNSSFLSEGQPEELIATVMDSDVTSFTDYNVKLGESFCYGVVAIPTDTTESYKLWVTRELATNGVLVPSIVKMPVVPGPDIAADAEWDVYDVTAKSYPDKVRLSWTPVPRVDAYRVSYKEDGEYTTLVDVLPANLPKTVEGKCYFDVVNLDFDGGDASRYKFRIHAKVKTNEGDPSARADGGRIECAPPTDAIGQHATENNQIDFSWSPVKDALQYVISYGDTESPTEERLTVGRDGFNLGRDGRLHYLKTFGSNEQTWVRVRAVAKDGNESYDVLIGKVYATQRKEYYCQYPSSSRDGNALHVETSNEFNYISGNMYPELRGINTVWFHKDFRRDGASTEYENFYNGSIVTNKFRLYRQRLDGHGDCSWKQVAEVSKGDVIDRGDGFLGIVDFHTAEEPNPGRINVKYSYYVTAVGDSWETSWGGWERQSKFLASEVVDSCLPSINTNVDATDYNEIYKEHFNVTNPPEPWFTVGAYKNSTASYVTVSATSKYTEVQGTTTYFIVLNEEDGLPPSNVVRKKLGEQINVPEDEYYVKIIIEAKGSGTDNYSNMETFLTVPPTGEPGDKVDGEFWQPSDFKQAVRYKTPATFVFRELIDGYMAIGDVNFYNNPVDGLIVTWEKIAGQPYDEVDILFSNGSKFTLDSNTTFYKCPFAKFEDEELVTVPDNFRVKFTPRMKGPSLQPGTYTTKAGDCEYLYFNDLLDPVVPFASTVKKKYGYTQAHYLENKIPVSIVHKGSLYLEVERKCVNNSAIATFTYHILNNGVETDLWNANIPTFNGGTPLVTEDNDVLSIRDYGNKAFFSNGAKFPNNLTYYRNVPDNGGLTQNYTYQYRFRFRSRKPDSTIDIEDVDKFSAWTEPCKFE